MPRRDLEQARAAEYEAIAKGGPIPNRPADNDRLKDFERNPGRRGHLTTDAGADTDLHRSRVLRGILKRAWEYPALKDRLFQNGTPLRNLHTDAGHTAYPAEETWLRNQLGLPAGFSLDSSTADVGAALGLAADLRGEYNVLMMMRARLTQSGGGCK